MRACQPVTTQLCFTVLLRKGENPTRVATRLRGALAERLAPVMAQLSKIGTP